MFGKILKTGLIVGGVYLTYKIGYAFGLKKADPVLQQLEQDLASGKIDIQEYLKRYQERIQEIEGVI